ncbi:MAG: hypothetical protein ACKOE6_04425 [Flammeovirgaceae bacterium]
MSKATQLQEALEHAEANVQHMATWSERQLAERLELVHIQSQLAEEKRDTAALELLEVWRSQLIAARLYKTEHAIADVPSEIKQAIADIEIAQAHAEERHEVLQEEPEPPRPSRKPQPQTKPSEKQLGLF